VNHRINEVEFELDIFERLKERLDIKNIIYYTIRKLTKLKFRITPIIWFGGLYQEPIILDYEEDAIICIFFVIRNFFYFYDFVILIIYKN
jgi:hypothetical protein